MSLPNVPIPESDRHLGTYNLQLHRVKASPAHPGKHLRHPSSPATPMDSSLPHSDDPAFLLSPSQPRQAPPALHKSCGLKDRSLSESWTATHFSLPIQGISPGPPPPLSQHFLSALLPALPPPREETPRPTVGSQALLHPPSTPMAWPTSPESEASAPPCAVHSSHHVLLLGNSKLTHSSASRP